MGGRGLGLWGRRIQAMWAWPRAVNQTGSIPRIYFYLLCKYADDTYLIIPAQNYQSRSAELDHIETWAARSNLHLNRVKCVELITSVPRRRRQFNLPPCISDITRVSSLKILGVTITGKMSVCQ